MSKTTDQFIAEAKSKHGDNFDYSKVDYQNSKINIIIICPIHGEFEQRPDSHLNGNGCKRCAIVKKAKALSYTTPEFINRAKLVFGDAHIYDKTVYEHSSVEITITCRKHGDFKTLPNNYLTGNGCNKCFNDTKLKNKRDYFFDKVKSIHGDKYDYSLVSYTGCYDKVTIVCPVHGEFNQTITNHLLGKGCQKCVGKGFTTEEIVKQCKKIHGDRYDYTKVNYINFSKKITIICPEHGEFQQTFKSHKKGYGCRKCSKTHVPTNSEVIEAFMIYHQDKYDYTNVNYVSAHVPVKIICPKHGEFEQTPNNHKRGQGCPNCTNSLGESYIRRYLLRYNIDYIPQYKFENCKHKRGLPFDFFLPTFNTCIEFHGEQHYRPVDMFGGQTAFEFQQKKDKIKSEFCEKNGITLLVIKYNQNIEKMLDDYFKVVNSPVEL